MGKVLGKLFRFHRLHLLSIVQKMEAAKLVELEKKLKKEQGSVTKERLEELLVEAIDPTKAAIVVDLIFSALDLPEDGSIDVDMLDRLVEPSSGEMVKQRLAWLFRMYDTDASGTITLGEMVEIFSGLYLSEGLDLDAAVDRAEEIFAELDDDHDGEITEKEFIEGCLEDEVGRKDDNNILHSSSQVLVAEVLEVRKEDSDSVEVGSSTRSEGPAVRNSQSVEKRSTTKRRYSNMCPR